MSKRNKNRNKRCTSVHRYLRETTGIGKGGGNEMWGRIPTIWGHIVLESSSTVQSNGLSTGVCHHVSEICIGSFPRDKPGTYPVSLLHGSPKENEKNEKKAKVVHCRTGSQVYRSSVWGDTNNPECPQCSSRGMIDPFVNVSLPHIRT